MRHHLRDRYAMPLTVLASLALVLAACSGATPTPSPAPTQAPSAPPSAAPSATAAPDGFSPDLLGAPEQTHVRIGSATLEANNMIPEFARVSGLFEKYGLTVEIIPFGEADQALQAIIAGQVDMLTETPNVTITSATTDNPLVNIATYTNKFVDCLVTSAAITDAETARGTRWAISSFGGQSHAEVVLSLAELGLTSEDVQIIQVGGQSDRVAALQAGSVDAIPVDCATGDDLVAEGFNELLNMAEFDVQFPGGGVQVNAAYAEANPNTTLRVVAANLEAMQLMFDDEDAAVASFAEWGQVDEATSREQVQQFKAVAQRDFRWTDAGMQNALDVQAVENPAVADLDPASLGDPSYLDQLEELGLNEALGIPAE